MTSRTYPLEAALKLRQMQLDEAQATLARALEQVRAAEAALTYSQERLRAHREQTRVEQEQMLTQIDPTTGRAMQDSDHYFTRRLFEADELERVCERRKVTLAEMQGEAENARAALTIARAEHRAVDKHRERWEQAQRKAAENRAEAEADDVLAGRRD